MNDFTLVVGVDERHLEQLAWTWPTWAKHKPSLLARPMVTFYDRDQLALKQVREVVDHPNLTCVAWPPLGADYGQEKTDKWDCPQRSKMLAGFVFVPAEVVKTPFYLKLDTDVVATGNDDWIDPAWFKSDTVIISHPWGFTRPPDQMCKLDEWVKNNLSNKQLIRQLPPLDLVPSPGQDRVCHPRIISWCGFFDTEFTQLCAQYARWSCPTGRLPVPSQDGYLWYVATRLGCSIIRTSMKKRGWQHWSTNKNVREKSKEAMR